MISYVIVFNYFRPNVSTAFKECVYASPDKEKVQQWLQHAVYSRQKYLNLPMIPVYWNEKDPTISDSVKQKLDHYVIQEMEDNT